METFKSILKKCAQEFFILGVPSILLAYVLDIKFWEAWMFIITVDLLISFRKVHP